jgi:hypothetical protein
MTELAGVNVYRPIPAGGQFLKTITELVWPTWRRVTLEQGGDHEADFYVDTDSHPVTRDELEYIFANWVGHHVEESYGGEVTFMGYIHSMRLYSGGVTWTVTMETVANHVRVLYQPDSATTATITTTAQDLDSQTIYGAKSVILEPRQFIDATRADLKRDTYLTWHAFPRTLPGEVFVDNDRATVLEVYIQGYIHTLDWKYYKETFSAAVDKDISTHLADVLTGHPYVSAGQIASDAAVVTTESDYVTVLRRIDDLLADTDYRYGCFAGRTFDYLPRDLTTIKYYRQSRGQRRGLFSGGLYVPEPLVTPGGLVWTEDVFAGTPRASTLIHDVRAAWIASVQYSIDGVTIMTGDEFDDAWANADVALALGIEADESRQTPVSPWVDFDDDDLVISPPPRSFRYDN